MKIINVTSIRHVETKGHLEAQTSIVVSKITALSDALNVSHSAKHKCVVYCGKTIFLTKETREEITDLIKGAIQL